MKQQDKKTSRIVNFCQEKVRYNVLRLPKQALAFLIALVLLSSTAFIGEVFAFSDTRTKSYIVVTRDRKARNRVAKAVEIDENSALLENDILVAELTNSEAKALNKADDILAVEEDFVIEASVLDEDDEDLDIPDYTPEEVAAIKQARFEAMQEQMNREFVPPDEYEWNMQVVEANDVDAEEFGDNAQIKVAVLDSGVDIVRGIDLSDSVNLVPEEQYISPMFVDMSGHGTGIASIIAGTPENEVQGVNPNAQLYSVKVLDDENRAPLSRIIEGIYWCIDNEMQVVNMSFGTSVYSLALEIAVEDAWDAGILMVGASGNSGGAVEYPAAFPEVMAVAATGTDAQLTDFSNTGDTLEIAAPGEKIKTAGFFGGSTVTQGTSIATPHVTGAASLLWQKDPSKSAEFIRQLLVHSTKNIENTDDCGLLDVEFALSLYDDFAANWSDEGLVVTRPERLQENNAAAQTFEEIDDDEGYVEGRWGPGNHELTVTLGVKGNGFNSTEIAILKKGVIYPDDPASGVGGSKDNPEFHGYYKHEADKKSINYIAAYNLLQAIAKRAGDASSLTYTSVKGFTYTASYNRIIKAFSDPTKFGVKGGGKDKKGKQDTYATILSSFSYSSQTTAKQKRYRQLFIYGMAAHVIGDSFAHSTLAKDSAGAIRPIKHGKKLDNGEWDGSVELPGADYTNVFGNRYECAKLAVEQTMWNAADSTSYGWIDYANAIYYVETKNKNVHTFYMANILTHATANSLTTSSIWYNDFVFINYVAKTT